MIVGNLVRAAETALKLEERRLLKYKELEDKNQPIISSSAKVGLYVFVICCFCVYPKSGSSLFFSFPLGGGIYSSSYDS